LKVVNDGLKIRREKQDASYVLLSLSYCEIEGAGNFRLDDSSARSCERSNLNFRTDSLESKQISIKPFRILSDGFTSEFDAVSRHDALILQNRDNNRLWSIAAEFSSSIPV
jgi:hypothetical protein